VRANEPQKEGLWEDPGSAVFRPVKVHQPTKDRKRGRWVVTCRRNKARKGWLEEKTKRKAMKSTGYARKKLSYSLHPCGR